MAYMQWCLLLFIMIFIISSFSVHIESFFPAHKHNAHIKVLNVDEELQRETLPLKMGQRFYKLHGLKESSWYEVKISYPASVPASFSLELTENLAELQRSRSRKLLNTEKIIFMFDSKKLSSVENETFVLVTVEPAGVVAMPNVQDQEVVLFNIICEELLIGIPHRAWLVGIAALLCLLFAAFIPHYFPPQHLLKMQSDTVSMLKDS